MIFEALDDADQYGYRADVTDAENNAADDCEGTGLGGNSQYTAQLTGAVNGQVTVPGVIDAGCPAGTYTVSVTLLATSGFSFTVTQAFQVLESSQSIVEPDTPTPTATPTDTPTPTATATPHRHGHQYSYSHRHADRCGHAYTNRDAHGNAHAKASALRADRRSACHLRARPANSLQHDLRSAGRRGRI